MLITFYASTNSVLVLTKDNTFHLYSPDVSSNMALPLFPFEDIERQSPLPDCFDLSISSVCNKHSTFP